MLRLVGVHFLSISTRIRLSESSEWILNGSSTFLTGTGRWVILPFVH